MFKSTKSSKDFFLQQTKAAREERAIEKDREFAVTRIQRCVRNWLSRKRFLNETLLSFDSYFSNDSMNCTALKPAAELYDILRRFVLIYKKGRDIIRVDYLCKYLLRSLDSDCSTFSYVGVALIKNRSNSWILQVKKIVLICLFELKYFYPEQLLEYKAVILRLHVILSFTCTRTWAIMRSPEFETLQLGMNQLCANVMGYLVNNDFYPIMQILMKNGLRKKNINFQPVVIAAVVRLTIRPLIFSKMSEKILMSYLINILSVPGLIHHLNLEEQSSHILLFRQNKIYLRSIKFLYSKQNLQAVINLLEGNYALYLLGNLIELAHIEFDECSNEINFSQFTFVTVQLLKFCQQYVSSKKSNTTYWHPILGWFEQPEDSLIQETILNVKAQLSFLWTGNVFTELIRKPLQRFLKKENLQPVVISNTSIRSSFFHRTFMENRKKKKQNTKKLPDKLKNSDVKEIIMVCSMYYTALCTLREMKSIMLIGLCFKDKSVLHDLWLFLRSLGPECGLKEFLNILNTDVNYLSPEYEMLIFFSECMTHYITILDEIEMYEQQDPFKLSDFIDISYFLNLFLFKYIINSCFDSKEMSHNPLLISLHTLLNTIYRRDCRKKFCMEGHWLIKEVRIASFLADFENGEHRAVFLLSKMPHIIPHSERVLLFRKYIIDEKEAMGLTESENNSVSSTLITVHRSRIVEDGYRQLSVIPTKSLKSVIRVRFINEQGLDEAGIDQDGVFKEFLEETIKRVFDPALNLFKFTNENRLYPSSTSYLQENHLLLFEFVGKILGKAIYEGIVIDVPFAYFFISQFCGHSVSVLHSWLDELASLDKDLYRSLTMVKRYQGDVSQLELTFSVDDNVMGSLVTYELKPGGKAISVTNENKINYIHLMARFRMYVQIRDQIAYFTKGFRSIINYEWLSLFSTSEWQRLISGDDIPLNFQDLRKYTQYYGGFHDKHRVICWLWDILEKDFSESERSLFLKFVTSCTKPPLLGFSNLEPPFSIRCVEVGDDDDTGDTVGSVIRGFFTIRKNDPQNRLPTSSTCFNLLKLPIYKKKCTLREKLRYAITSNTGFELS